MNEEFAAKTAFVTGAGSGIGAACARGLAARGAYSILADLDLESAESVADEIRAAGGKAHALRLDVRVPDQVESALERIGDENGALHIAVNSAGVIGPMDVLADTPLQGFEDVMATNAGGVFACMRAQIPQLVANGGGVIINIASVAGVTGFPGLSAYTASKHAVIGLTRAAAAEYGSAGVRVVAIAPGIVDTPMLADVPDEAVQASIAPQPVHRLGRPEEVASLVCYLASEAAGFITGSVHAIDGGYLCK
ncbi:SDR family NAD(P)-dependent oxidoreductase [Actinomadura hibisca]|uniref:SDR family NAD(P)-dependent oxidoreductase n=1 Tax=Actinomadura hibisca TaxID=68565 RepID=UPI000829AC7D|nr:SDR family NAD(P)-dependent oxidoreductase [Actinomadura hibisca]